MDWAQLVLGGLGCTGLGWIELGCVWDRLCWHCGWDGITGWAELAGHGWVWLRWTGLCLSGAVHVWALLGMAGLGYLIIS